MPLPLLKGYRGSKALYKSLPYLSAPYKRFQRIQGPLQKSAMPLCSALYKSLPYLLHLRKVTEDPKPFTKVCHASLPLTKEDPKPFTKVFHTFLTHTIGYSGPKALLQNSAIPF
ncbi:hypothetical protein PoB_002406900 [Plakobranchus ocellatus]|uniref:Uncharacterized protein n=1 Tax=Plakobranchus ocellatus TaxID=259542 RepID=A0AAV3ZT26_9GAST|nr:hypothetical protein PoB_002406900 [Plakobranchus ocellatus]